MDGRSDTSSAGRFEGQWSFLQHAQYHPAPPLHHNQHHPHSLVQHQHDAIVQGHSRPPSTYIRSSDQSSVSPLQTGQYQYHHTTGSGSRSSLLSRNLPSAPAGARSVTTIPSQPVLLRVHSADASAHLHPAPRPSRPQKIKMNRVTSLPAIEEYSIQGIMNAIQPDIQTDINTIAEILGRSRLVLAGQHDSHLPPQGEIRANVNNNSAFGVGPHSLQAVEEASASNERLPIGNGIRLGGDDVIILREDASLIDGSQAGSAAYGLLERIQAVPRASRTSSDMPVSRTTISHDHVHPPARTSSSPTVVMADRVAETGARMLPGALAEHYASAPARSSLNVQPLTNSVAINGNGTADAVVSETYLSAGASSMITAGLPSANTPALPAPIHRGYWVTHDESDTDALLPGRTGPAPSRPNFAMSSNTGGGVTRGSGRPNVRRRMQSLLAHDFSGVSSWLQPRNPRHTNAIQDAESQLRGLLNR